MKHGTMKSVVITLGAMVCLTYNVHSQGYSSCSLAGSIANTAFTRPVSNIGYAKPATSPTLPSMVRTASISWPEFIARSSNQYVGEGLQIEATPAGAQLRCVFQRLKGEARVEGLRLVSTESKEDKVSVKATTIGRNHGDACTLITTGCVEVVDRKVRFVREDVTEEYSVAADGIRQDFILNERLPGESELHLLIGVSGAQVESAVDGVRLVYEGTGRGLIYGQLKVTDNMGCDLPARMEKKDGHNVIIYLDDRDAQYPVRVDPTFSDANWVSMGSLPGVDGAVSAAVVDHAGNLYVAGYIGVAGSVFVVGVAKWDGSDWSALGSGLSGGAVNALAVDSTGNLYAGGEFSNAGGATIYNIAKWDGNVWSALGSGINYSGVVSSLAVDGADNLYVGGSFYMAGGKLIDNIAKWDGHDWSAVGSGSGEVTALAIDGAGNIYASGCCGVAKWEGSAWSALRVGLGFFDGPNLYIRALAVDRDGNVYAGGSFISVDWIPVNNVAKWNGTTWSALGTGVDNEVDSLVVDGSGNLYVGGYLTHASGVPVNYIAKWDGSVWSDLGSGADVVQGGGEYPGVSALAVDGSGSLYAGGNFIHAGGIAATHVAKWNGNVWSALGTGINDTVYAITMDSSGNLYVGGLFVSVGKVAAYGVAKWDGQAWSALGAGMHNGIYQAVVYALATDSAGNLYAGGAFSTAGEVGANNLAKWDGSTWSALSTGLGDYAGDHVRTLALDGLGNLYAGGAFSKTRGATIYNIAKWDGNTWSALAVCRNILFMRLVSHAAISSE